MQTKTKEGIAVIPPWLANLFRPLKISGDQLEAALPIILATVHECFEIWTTACTRRILVLK